MNMNQLDAFPGGPKKARIEIIPLIDVVFFLLATFVLFTLSLNKNRVLDFDLPKAPPDNRSTDIDTTLYIQASESGTYYWKRGSTGEIEMVASAQLRDRLLGYRNEPGEPRVFIRSDTKAKFGDAVLVLDEVRRAGIKQVSVETMSSKTGN
ncbi:MAG: biopolymer transporter ExbD [Verrucomicrobiota bacterium]